MVLYLKAKEFMDCSDCFGILACDPDTCSAGNLFDLILDFTAQLFQCRNAGWRTRVDQHRRVEVTPAEHGGDVLEVFKNLLPAGRIGRIVRDCLDAAAISEKLKMMRRLVMGKAHHLITALHNSGVVLVNSLLSHCSERR